MKNKKFVAGLLTVITLTGTSPFVCSNANADPDTAAAIGAIGLFMTTIISAPCCEGYKKTNQPLALANQQALAYLSRGNQTGEAISPILAQFITERRQKLTAEKGADAVAKMSDAQVLLSSEARN